MTILCVLIYAKLGKILSFISRYRSKCKMDPTNKSLSEESLRTPYREAISAEIFWYLDLILNMTVNSILGLAGTVLNVINVTVFYKMGLSDGVTRNFFILAFSDGLFASLTFVNKVLLILLTVIRIYIGYGGVEQIISIVFHASFYSFPYIQSYSLITTVVIAVVRCCCVAMPLKVKHILTARHQMAAILILLVLVTCILVYVHAPLSIVHIPNPKTNTTFGVFLGARWSTYAVFNNIFSFGSFIICIACVIILSTSLRKASRFRDSSTVGTSTSANHGKTSAPDAASKERQRNARVVRTVLLVCIIFIVSNVPSILFYVLLATVEGFGPVGKYENTTAFTIMIGEMFMLVSVSLNTIIYILYNSRYRIIFLSMFRGESEASRVGY